MSKKLVAAIAAAVLAVLGVVALLVYANGATQRANDDAELVKVLRVTEVIPANTSAEEASGSLETAEVPRAVVPDGAMTSLDKVAGLTTNTELQPGEVLIAARFGTKTVDGEASSTVPEGYQEVSISIPAPRVPGGSLKPGDRVGLIASYDGSTNVAVQNVEVTRVSTAMVTQGADASGASVLITFAVKTLDAEKIVNASEFGQVWLTLQNDKTDRSGAKLITQEEVLG